MKVPRWIFITIFISSFLSGYISEASRCFNCTSLQEPSCLDPFSTEGRVPSTCPDGAGCAKIITGNHVTRGCMTLNQSRQDSVQSDTDDENCYTDVVSPSFETRTVCKCEDDLCNSTVSVNVDIITVAVALIAPLLLWT